MKKIKKFLALSIALAVLFQVPAAQASASLNEVIDIRPMYIDIAMFANSFNIDQSSGAAGLFSSVSSGSSDRQEVYVYLEKKNAQGSWGRIKSWSDSSTNGFACVAETYYVVSGEYRMVATCYTYRNGKITDFDTYTSPSKVYTWK